MDAVTGGTAGTVRWIWVHGWGVSPDVWRDVIPHVPGRHVLVSFRDCRHIDDCRQTVRRQLLAVINGAGRDEVRKDTGRRCKAMTAAAPNNGADNRAGEEGGPGLIGRVIDETADDGAADGTADQREGGPVSDIAADRPGPVVLVGWSMGGMLALETVCDLTGDRCERSGGDGADERMGNGDEAAGEAMNRTVKMALGQRAESRSGRTSPPLQPGRARLPDGLVMVSSTLKFTRGDGQPAGWPEKVLRRMIDRLRQDPDEVLRQFHARFRLSADEARALTNEYAVPALTSGLEYLIEADLRGKWAALARALGSAGMEMLWIHGTEDDVCPPGSVPESGGHERRMLAGAGHAPFVTHRETFCDILNRFCRKLGGSD